jgi:uncharacterized protein with GYD domain
MQILGFQILAGYRWMRPVPRCILALQEVDMATYIILSCISPEAVKDPKNFKDLAKTVSETIKRQCPGVTWKASYATLGRFDVVDIVEADSLQEVEKAAMIIRSYGHSSTETLAATPWDDFVTSLGG